MREEQVESEGQGLGRRPGHSVGMSGSGSVQQAGMGTQVAWGLWIPPPAPQRPFMGLSLRLAYLRVGPGLRTPVTRSGFEGHGEDRSQDLETC